MSRVVRPVPAPFHHKLPSHCSCEWLVPVRTRAGRGAVPVAATVGPAPGLLPPGTISHHSRLDERRTQLTVLVGRSTSCKVSCLKGGADLRQAVLRSPPPHPASIRRHPRSPSLAWDVHPSTWPRLGGGITAGCRLLLLLEVGWSPILQAIGDEWSWLSLRPACSSVVVGRAAPIPTGQVEASFLPLSSGANLYVLLRRRSARHHALVRRKPPSTDWSFANVEPPSETVACKSEYEKTSLSSSVSFDCLAVVALRLPGRECPLFRGCRPQDGRRTTLLSPLVACRHTGRGRPSEPGPSR